jgi:hypothetical protein
VLWSGCCARLSDVLKQRGVAAEDQREGRRHGRLFSIRGKLRQRVLLSIFGMVTLARSGAAIPQQAGRYPRSRAVEKARMNEKGRPGGRPFLFGSDSNYSLSSFSDCFHLRRSPRVVEPALALELEELLPPLPLLPLPEPPSWLLPPEARSL